MDGVVQEVVDRWHFGTATDDGRFPACIVAVATIERHHNRMTILSWSAYGGGFPLSAAGVAGEQLVARGGDKLSKARACAIFRVLPADLYRE